MPVLLRSQPSPDLSYRKRRARIDFHRALPDGRDGCARHPSLMPAGHHNDRKKAPWGDSARHLATRPQPPGALLSAGFAHSPIRRCVATHQHTQQNAASRFYTLAMMKWMEWRTNLLTRQGNAECTVGHK